MTLKHTDDAKEVVPRYLLSWVGSDFIYCWLWRKGRSRKEHIVCVCAFVKWGRLNGNGDSQMDLGGLPLQGPIEDDNEGTDFI